MVPTPTPAPPMPMQAMPAPIYLAAIGSMMNNSFFVWLSGKRPSVAAWVKRIVEVNASEDCKHVSLQKSDQQLERRERYSQCEGKGRADPTDDSKPSQHSDESREHLEGDVTG